MKKITYVLILSMLVVSALVFSFAPFANGSGVNREIKNETSKNSTSKPLSANERKAALKKWEATSDGIMYNKWKASPAGKKVYANEAKIRKSITDYTEIEAVVTSLSLPPGSKLGFGVMVRINGEDYILSFGDIKTDKYFSNFKNDIQQLLSLKVNDKIIIKSHSVSHSPKYAYPILSGDYVERDNKIIYKRAPNKDGC